MESKKHSIQNAALSEQELEQVNGGISKPIVPQIYQKIPADNRPVYTSGGKQKESLHQTTSLI